MEKTYKVTELSNLFTVIITMCLYDGTPNAVKDNLILGPKFDTLWENHTSSCHRCVCMQTLYSDAEIGMTLIHFGVKTYKMCSQTHSISMNICYTTVMLNAVQHKPILDQKLHGAPFKQMLIL